MRILITGSRGQLGYTLSKSLQSECEVLTTDREELDFTNADLTLREITSLHPEIILHCGAYTDVRGSEQSPEKAFLTNALGTRNIAVAALECNAALVYISTDYVFDGGKKTPYTEYDTPNPINIYGKSKLAGEEIIQSLLQKYYIIRTAWLYGEHGNNFLKTMLHISQRRREISVVDDEKGTPTYVRDLAEVIKQVIAKPFYGIYHASNNGSCSWYDFARIIFRLKGIEMNVKPITAEEYGDCVKRPAYSVLQNFNLEQTYGHIMRDWEEALVDCLRQVT